MAQGRFQQQTMPTLSAKTEIKGIFSTQEIRKVGTGTTTRKTVQKTFWFIEQHGDVIECQPLNPNYVPSGPKRKISLDELVTKFSPEPEFYQMTVAPRMKELNQTIDRADNHRNKGENFTAEYEYSRALTVDEENVRANFGIGLTYLERGETHKAENIFERLIKLESAFAPEHKHLFNEFGINLRKCKMYRHSVDYYLRAIQLSPRDENLHMNLARAYMENKNTEKCIEHIFKSLEINPNHEMSLKFLSWLDKKSLIPEENQDKARQLLNSPNNTNEIENLYANQVQDI